MARPQIRLTFTAPEPSSGADKSFRVVQDDAVVAGAWTIEVQGIDAVGDPAWSTYCTVSSASSDRGNSKLTPNIVSAMLDAALAT